MTEREPKVLLEGLVFGEAPRWHNGRLWFSDMLAHEVVAVDLEGHRETIVHVPQQPSGLGWLPDGRLLIVSMVDRKLLCLGQNGLTPYADLWELAGFHCNDMVVDEVGRAYVGNFGFDIGVRGAVKPANLILVAQDGDTCIAAEDLLFPNGTVITPNGRTLIVAETFAKRLTAFNIGADGVLSNRRVWAQLNFMPDGICLDAEGCIWVAAPKAPGAFVRVAEGGEIKERIDLIDHGAFACMLGGPDGRTLFMLEAFPGSAEQTIRKGRGNGRIRIVEVDTPRAGLP